MFEFVVCRGGRGRFVLDDRQIEIVAGRTLIIAPGVVHRYEFEPGEQADIKFLCLNAQDAAANLSPPQLAVLDGVRATLVSHADHTANAARVWELAGLVREGFNVSDAGDWGIAWGTIGLMLALHAQAGKLPQDYAWRRYRHKIDEIREWVDERLHQVVSLQDVTAEFGLSRSLLTREFRRHTGKSFVDYCNARRIEKAATLLAAHGESVTEAALGSGFSNLSHFHRQFKSVYGVTPASFRRHVLGG